MNFQVFANHDQCIRCFQGLHPKLWKNGIRVCEDCQRKEQEKAKEEARSNALGRANGRIRG